MHIKNLLDTNKAAVGRLSVRSKILGIILGLTLVLGLSITWQVRSSMKSFVHNELDLLGQSHVGQLAENISHSIAEHDVTALASTLDNSLAQNSDSVYAFVLDTDGIVVAHTFESAEVPAGIISGAISSEEHFDYEGSNGIVHSYSSPIPNSNNDVLFLGLTEARLTQSVNETTIQLLATTLLVGLVGAATAALLTWVLTRPILDLVQTTDKIGQGDLSTRATVWAADEIGSLAGSINQMATELESNRDAIEEHRATRTRLLEQLINAQEDERKRIARELHDTVGQALSSIMLNASLIERADINEDERTRAIGVRQLSAETLEEVRRMSRELRPSVLDDLGLSAALDRYAAELHLRYPELMIEMHSDLSRRLPPGVETGIYRVLQEGMTNAARHSQASTLSVLVTLRADRVQAIVEDNGVGFDPAMAQRNGQSVGIHGMAERIELLNGTFDIESSQNGTSLYIEVVLESLMVDLQ